MVSTYINNFLSYTILVKDSYKKPTSLTGFKPDTLGKVRPRTQENCIRVIRNSCWN